MGVGQYRREYSMIEIDPTTGSFKADFDVGVDGEELVFRPTGMRETGCCGPNAVERYDITDEFMGLVVNEHEGHRYEYGLGVPLYPLHEAQYRLVDDTCQGLVRLARRTGPIFGDDLSGTGARFANGEIREPVAWWVSAAGCIRLAAVCASVADGEARTSSLDDELVVWASLFTRAGMPGTLVTTRYAADQGFPGDYGIMLTSSTAGQRHALLSEHGRVGSRDTLVASGYGTSTVYREMRRELLSGVRAAYGRATPFDEGEVDAVIDLAANGLSPGSPPTVECVTAEPCSTIGALYVIRYVAKGDPGSLLGVTDPYVNPNELEGVFSITTRIPNGEVLEPDLWKTMYKDMYDALVKLHTNRSAPDLSRGRDVNPFYANLVERIWCAFARKRVGQAFRMCPQCLRVFPADGKKQYCSDACRNNFNGRRARKKDAAIDEFLLRTMRPGILYSEMGLCHMFNEHSEAKLTPEKVRARLECLLKSGKIHRSSGQGRVWEVVA